MNLSNKNIIDNISINYHASIRMEKKGVIIYVDPYRIKNVKNDADYIFITHKHYDHFSPIDIMKVLNDTTKFIVPMDLKEELINLGVLNSNIILVKPNEIYNLKNISFEVIKAYNINKEYHKKEYNWVGYNISIDNVKYYVVGDSDIIPEMDNILCDVLFVPVGGTYTMDYKDAILLANKLKPRYAIPVHYGEVGSICEARKLVENIDTNINAIIIGD